jgi:hypothetical protein
MGSGTWMGNMSQANVQCSTQYTPAQNVPINWNHYTIYNLVETANSYMVVACTRNVVWSKCTYLIPGDTFSFGMEKGKVSVLAQRGMPICWNDAIVLANESLAGYLPPPSDEELALVRAWDTRLGCQ